MHKLARQFALCLVLLTGLAVRVHATQVQDLVRIKGAESSKLVGMGLVLGLSGTGDGGKFTPAMQSLARVIEHLAVGGVTASDLKNTKNVAMVALTVNVPENGVREGDHLDVHISSIGPAKSLIGGRLFLIPMTGPLPGSDIFAYAEGPVSVEDIKLPNTGVIKNGAQMVKDIRAQYMDDYGQVTFVIDDKIASWPTASNLASHINGVITLDDGPDIARAVDPKNITVQLPRADQNNPGAFLSQILTSYIDPPLIGTGARVKINEKARTIVFGANVQISPVVISTQGLTITTVTPPIEPTPETPLVETNNWVAIDPEKRGGTKLADLLNALKQLRVEAKDRIAIVKELDKVGALHAELIIE